MDRHPTGKEERHSDTGIPALVIFYLFAFGISWLGFVPIFVGAHGVPFFQSRFWLAALVLPGVGPAVAAAIAGSLYPLRENDPGPLIRLRRSFLKPVPLRWWVTTILLSVGIKVVASLLTQAFSADRAQMISRISAPDLLLFSIMSLAANPFEEIGWRGFAQTRLQQTHTALMAAFIVGLFWAIWHIPLFLLPSSPVSMSQTPFWAWAAGVVPQAILLAWLYNRTERSLATVSVFHILGNISGSILESSTWMVSAVRFALALIVLFADGPSLGQRDNIHRSR